jgi:multiple sugar transport system ATP-binding protein
MAEVVLTHVDKVYPGNVKAVSDVNLTVQNGEFVVLVGPSGCGKSTTLRMVAGLEEITAGTISIDGRVVNDVPPKDRDIAMIFQNYALYPHMTVFDNMAFGLKLRRFKKADIQQRVSEAAEILGLTSYLKRLPKQLSGGQRQRVAVGRAIVRKPKVFLFDEPLSNLDAKMRVEMRSEISRLHKRLEATMIYVTHDQVEAMTMGDRIVVMDKGLVQQIADPLALYDQPANRFVAGFIGTPPMNFAEGRLSAAGSELRFEHEAFALALPGGWMDRVQAWRGKPAILGVRPEDIGSSTAEQNAGAPRIRARVDVVEPMGSETYVHLQAGPTRFISRVDPHRRFADGATVDLAVAIQKGHLFDKATGEVIV